MKTDKIRVGDIIRVKLHDIYRDAEVMTIGKSSGPWTMLGVFIPTETGTVAGHIAELTDRIFVAHVSHSPQRSNHAAST